MTDPRVYLDHNATTTVRPAVIERMVAVLAETGNPSSAHAEGRAKRRVVEEARRAVAALVGAEAADVTFTSGATEAANLALSPSIQDRRDPRPVTRLAASAIEHPAVASGGRFPAAALSPLAVGAAGVVDNDSVDDAFARHARERPGERMMLALTLASNETGVIQPVAEIAGTARRYGGVVLVDAVQAAGKIAVDIGALGCDFLILSAHKFGGPAGVGALVRAGDAIHLADPLIRGGGQERGLRSGTENVAGIAGMGVAAAEAAGGLDAFAALAAIRDRIEDGVKRSGAVIFGGSAPRLPNTTCFAQPGVAAERALIALDLAGVAVSTGSACSSGKAKASQLLDAMGVNPDLSKGMVRVSLGWPSQPGDADRFLAAWSGIAPRHAPDEAASAA